MWTSWTLLQVLGAIIGIGIVRFWLKLRNIRCQYQYLPGPEPLPVLGNLLEFVKKDFDVVKTIVELANRYRGLFVVYIGHRPVVIVSDPEHLKVFYTNTTLLDREIGYEYLADIVGASVFVANGADWKKLRRILTVNFARTPTEIFMTSFMDVTQRALVELRKKANGPMFECFKLFQMTTIDSIFLNTVGERMDYEEQKLCLDTVDLLFHVMYQRNANIFLQNNFFFSLLPIGREYWSRVAMVQNLIRQFVIKKGEEFKDMEKKGENAPDIYIYNWLKNNPGESVEVITNEFMTLLAAGLDTIVATSGFVLICLGLFPDIQEKVYQEDREVQSILAGRQLEVDDLQNYSYLEMVIKETLRIFPLVPMLARRTSEDTYFGKNLVPKGTNVAALQIFANHSPQIFKEPFHFDPDRFLPENVEKLPPYAYNPFSAGPRGCPGLRYAYMAMKVTLPSIVREFRIFSKYSSLEEAINNTEAGIVFKDKNEFLIRLETRK